MDWSSFGLGILAIIIVSGALYLALRKPKWTQYLPMIATVFKGAERVIPDDTPNKALAKADWFARRLGQLFEQEAGKPPPKSFMEYAQRVAFLMAQQAKIPDAVAKGIQEAVGVLAKVMGGAHASNDSDDSGGSGSGPAKAT